MLAVEKPEHFILRPDGVERSSRWRSNHNISPSEDSSGSRSKAGRGKRSLITMLMLLFSSQKM